MKLIKCYIENFGVLQNFKYEFKDGLNTIKEENGFGKTTFATFIKSMFYGLDASNKAENSDRKKFKPWQGGEFGGNLEFEIKDKKYRIERFFGSKASDDVFKLYDLSTNLKSNDYTSNIGEEIFKINKSAYERSTYIPQDQIQIEMEDSLNAKLGNVLENENDINTSEKAINKIIETMKVYKKTGNKGLLNEKKEKLNVLKRNLENNKSDFTNLEIRENILSELSKNIKQKMEVKKQKQDLFAKKIEQGRKLAKRETYNNILLKLNENEEKFNKLQEFFKFGIPSDDDLNKLNLKIIEIEKSKVEIKNKKMQEEEQEKLEELESKFFDANITEGKIENDLAKIEKQSEDKNKKCKIISIISLIGAILGIIIATQNMAIGIALVILCMIIIISSIVNMKNGDYADKIITLTNLKNEFELYKNLKEKSKNLEAEKYEMEKKTAYFEDEMQKFLLKYFSHIDKTFSELIQNIKIKKNEMDLINRELESSKKAKEEFEKANNIKEIQEEDIELENINESELSKEIDSLDVELDKLNDEKNQNKNQIELLENKISEDEYIESDIANLTDEIEDLNHRYKILEKTKELMLKAKQSFSSTYLKDMTDEFERYLKIIDSKEMNTNVDINLDVKIDVNGSKKEIKYFSAGYKDFIYICMRLSLVRTLYKDELPFVILDDPFVNLDDEKTKKAINLINEFSKQYQVIYLVCNTSRTNFQN